MPRLTDEELFLKNLGSRLRQIREKRGWTLEETEEHGWPNWRHLQRIETGKNVTAATLFRLSKLYGMSFEKLFPNKG